MSRGMIEREMIAEGFKGEKTIVVMLPKIVGDIS